MKKDAVPGMTTDGEGRADPRGDYTLACTELCGLGHATMRARVKVEDQPAFDRWVAEGKKGRGPAASSPWAQTRSLRITQR